MGTKVSHPAQPVTFRPAPSGFRRPTVEAAFAEAVGCLPRQAERRMKRARAEAEAAVAAALRVGNADRAVSFAGPIMQLLDAVPVGSMHEAAMLEHAAAGREDAAWEEFLHAPSTVTRIAHARATHHHIATMLAKMAAARQALEGHA